MPAPSAEVTKYIAAAPAEHRAALNAVRKVFLDNLDSDYAEAMAYGMIGYCVPHSVFPDGYHCDPRQPLPLGGIASRKGGMSLHLMTVYGDSVLRDWFLKAWKQSGKKLDMGKACIRFKKIDDLPLDVIAEAIRRVPAQKYIETYLNWRPASAAKGTAAGTATPASKTKRKTKPAAKKAAAKKKVASKKNKT